MKSSIFTLGYPAGAQIGISNPGLIKDFDGELPGYLTKEDENGDAFRGWGIWLKFDDVAVAAGLPAPALGKLM